LPSRGGSSAEPRRRARRRREQRAAAQRTTACHVSTSPRLIGRDEHDLPVAVDARLGRDGGGGGATPGPRSRCSSRSPGRRSSTHSLPSRSPSLPVPSRSTRVARKLLHRLRDEAAAVGLRLAEIEAVADAGQALATFCRSSGDQAGRFATGCEWRSECGGARTIAARVFMVAILPPFSRRRAMHLFDNSIRAMATRCACCSRSSAGVRLDQPRPHAGRADAGVLRRNRTVGSRHRARRRHPSRGIGRSCSTSPRERFRR
jgi:hypothetical protein